MSSDWYPGANEWEDKGNYQIKYKFKGTKCTDILMARAGLTRRQADQEHIHIWRLGEPGQGNRFKDSDGKVYDLSDNDIKQILSGYRPLF